MALTTGQVVTLFIGLRSLDQQLEKATPDTRFKIGLLLNKVQPIAELFERTQQRTFASINTESAKKAGDKAETPAERQVRDVMVQADIADAIEKLRDTPIEDLQLKTILKSELRLDENPKVNGMTISQIMPILEGIE